MGIYSMNWQAIGAIGEVLGGLAVFISLLYLAMQIRSSRRSDQIVVAADAASAVDQWLGQIVRDENLYVLYRRGLIDYDSLSREEKGRFALLILQYLRRLEAVWFHHEAGTISASYWNSLVAALVLSLSAEGGARSFKKYAGSTVALDPTTGEVRVMASYPMYNPNDFSLDYSPGIAALSSREARFTPLPMMV